MVEGGSDRRLWIDPDTARWGDPPYVPPWTPDRDSSPDPIDPKGQEDTNPGGEGNGGSPFDKPSDPKDGSEA